MARAAPRSAQAAAARSDLRAATGRPDGGGRAQRRLPGRAIFRRFGRDRLGPAGDRRFRMPAPLLALSAAVVGPAGRPGLGSDLEQRNRALWRPRHAARRNRLRLADSRRGSRRARRNDRQNKTGTDKARTDGMTRRERRRARKVILLGSRHGPGDGTTHESVESPLIERICIESASVESRTLADRTVTRSRTTAAAPRR